MTKLHRAVASLSLTGDNLNPEKVTELLGGQPTHSWCQGDDIRLRPDLPPKFAHQGHWRKEAKPTEPANLDAQVIELLDDLTEIFMCGRALVSSSESPCFAVGSCP